ncbi:MAG: caspase family protein [Crocinitomicaceae bacterium]|nr:caspase family protein [Crocinitomicaceae bacterium]MCF8433785.1 caspase family protein [Crocinitomicaceae bacterium]
MIKSLLIFFLLLLCKESFSQDARGAGVENTSTNGFKNVYGLIVGISEYKNATSLKYADNDAELITKVIESNFPQAKNNIIKLVNKQATELAIKSGLGQINKKAQAGDLVIFYFAGHGDVANIEGSDKGYFLAHNASESRDYEAGGAVRFTDVHDSIVKITSKGAKVYLITDACRSGTIIDAKGASLTLAAFNTGYLNTTKFISCQANELSYEYDSLAHGAFTYYLTKSISGLGDSDLDKLLTLNETQNYLINTVRPLTKKLQTPTIQGADQFAEIFNCQPDVISFFSVTGAENDVTAPRGKDIKDKTPLLVKFEDAILADDLYGKSSSAEFILENAIKTKAASSEEIADMKFQLADALMNRSQETMNIFLRGKPMTQKNDDFATAAMDLKKAGILLGNTHPVFTTIMNRSAFFEAMEIIKNKNQSELAKAESILISLEKKEPKATYVHQGLAMLYILKNNKQQALTELAETHKQINTWAKPKNTEAYLSILSGELDKSLTLLKESEKLSSDVSDVYLLRSQMHLANFQLMEAQKEIDKLANAAPGLNSAERALLSGKIEELRGRLKYAEKTYKEELKTNATNTTILLQLADLYLKEKDSVQSKEYYNKVLKLDSTNLRAKNSLANLTKGTISSINLDYYAIEEVIAHLTALELAGKNAEALVVINKALEINNWSPEYYFQKGKILFSLGRQEESAIELKKGIALSPYHYESLRELVIILIRQKKFVEADGILKQHDKYFPNSAKWLTFEYKAYRFMNSKNNLFPLLEKAIKMDSFDLEPYRALILLHIENNGFLNAQNELKTLLQIGGNDLDNSTFLYHVDSQVKSAFAKKNFYPLTDGIEILLKENPLDADYLYMGSMIGYMNKDYDKANAHLRNIAKFMQTLSPGSQLEYYKLKGKVLLETKNFEEAEKAFQMYNMKAGKPCYLGLAMAQFELGKKDSWIANLQKDMDISEFNEDANIRFQKMLKKAGM